MIPRIRGKEDDGRRLGEPEPSPTFRSVKRAELLQINAAWYDIEASLEAKFSGQLARNEDNVISPGSGQSLHGE
jgi:hypothetical protein